MERPKEYYGQAKRVLWTGTGQKSIMDRHWPNEYYGQALAERTMYALGTMLAGMPRTAPPIRRDNTSAGGRGICETAVDIKRWSRDM